MPRISISQFSTLRWSLFQDLLYYAGQQYESVGLWRTKVDDLGVSESVDLIHEMKFSVSSVHWAGGFTGSDGRTFVEAIDDGIDAIRLASSVHANCLLLHPGSRNGHTYGHSRRLIRNALQELVPVADDYDVCLALEPMRCGDAEDWTFVSSVQQCLKLIDAFPANRVGLVLDLFHLGTEASVFETFSSFQDRVKLVQIADRREDKLGDVCRCCLGQGVIPLDRWLTKLEQTGYRGPLEIELHGPGVAGISYETLLEESREFLAKSIALAQQANISGDVSHSGIKS